MSLQKIKVTPKHSGEISITNNVPSVLTPYLIAGAQVTVVTGKFGHILLQKINIISHVLWYSCFLIEHEESFHVVTNDTPLLQFFIHNSFYVEAEGETLIFMEGRYNFTYFPTGDYEIKFARGMYTHVCVEYPLPSLTEMAQLYSVMDIFIKSIKGTGHKAVTFLHPAHPLISIEMKSDIERLLYCNYHEDIKTTFLKGKLLDLLLEVMERAAHAPVRAVVDLTDKEIEQLNIIRDEVESNLNKVIRPHELARRAQMNIHKFNAAFKYLFTISLSEYHINARMKHAEAMLIDTDDSIDEIAEVVGYAGAKSFIKEFAKRHKEITPDKYRKIYRGNKTEGKDIFKKGDK